MASATLVLFFAMSTLGSVPFAFADNCALNVDKCNVEATRSPVVFWPLGVSSNFPTIGGTITNLVVNSVIVIADEGDQAESGWYLRVGRNRFQTFAARVFFGIYHEDAGPAPAGNFTWQYLTRFHSAGNDWESEAIGNGVLQMDFVYTNASFTNGYAITNVERHNSTDIFSGTPTFTNLQALSTNTWSFWPAAECFDNDDPMYQNNYFTNPTKVTVTRGSNC